MIVDLFGGPGGWDWALRLLGRTDVVGLEWDHSACRTRVAAGHMTIRADVATYPPEAFGEVEGLIASSPCPQFSNAGKRLGAGLMAELMAAIVDALDGENRLGFHRRVMARKLRRHLLLTTKATKAEAAARAWEAATEAALSIQPARWIHALRPRWVAMEQVPAAKPLFLLYARELRRLGYSAWAGVLNAADYGVPQTRQRVVLLASRDHAAVPPEPSHARSPEPSLFGQMEPWVTMAAALGWGETLRPSTALVTPSGGGHSPLDGGSNSRAARRGRMDAGEFVPRVGFARLDDRGDSPDGYRERDTRPIDQPAQAVTEKARSWTVRTGMNSMQASRDLADVVPYERSVDEPAPTLDTKVGRWKVAPEGEHVDPPMSWKVDTGRDWKPGGTRDDAQSFDPTEQPAPSIDTKGRWHLRPGGGGYEDANRRLYDPEEEPAPVVAFGHDASTWAWERPSTTIVSSFCPDVVAAPGWRKAGDGPRQNAPGSIRIEVWEAGVLQGFPREYPWVGTRTKQFEQVGNAVPPPLAAAVLRQLLAPPVGLLPSYPRRPVESVAVGSLL